MRDEGLDHLRRLSREDRLVVHWGMTMSAYPFWGTVAEATGRLLRLQPSVTAAQVQRRVRERMGERETVARAARRILRCFIDWEVLRDTGSKGEYAAHPPRAVEGALAAWLIEAVLISKGAAFSTIRELVGSPGLFPFRIGPIPSRSLSENPRFEVVRQGLDEEVVGFRR